VGFPIYFVELDAFLPLQSVSKFSISRQGQMLMSNMLPAFHVFKDHKMEEINLSGVYKILISHHDSAP
jgi:hypothetical protein